MKLFKIQYIKFRYVLVSMLLCMAAVVQAAESAAAASTAPDELVRRVTDTLLTDIASYREALAKAGQTSEKNVLLQDFYQTLTTTLKPIIDFNWISLNVMGKYRKQASSEQRKHFKEVFTTGLVETYGRGLLSYSDQKIIVHPLSDSDKDKRKVVVNQEIRGADKSYPLQYSMGLNRDGEWKVINVIINGINLGQTFRNQFDQAASTYNGDIDKVIANWTVSETE